MRSAFSIAAGWSWFLLFLVWLPGYFKAKRTLARPNLSRQLPVSALIVIGFLLLFVPRGLRVPVTPPNTAFGAVGLSFDLIGVGFAIWARLTLGRNWSGLVMTVKEGHELVQTGPYALVRHPIYAGMALGMLGAALTIGDAASYLGFALGLIAFLLRVAMEERLMAGRFGADFDSYRRRTARLVPFVW